MTDQVTDITRWYNNKAKWPDLSIELADGRSIRVHRLILHEANQYFECLCDRVHAANYLHKLDDKERHSIRKIGLESLSPESAAAVIPFVRAIYGFPLPPAADLVWASWFDIAAFAPKHLPPKVSEEAVQNFMTSFLEQTDADEVVRILQKLDHHNHPSNVEYVEKIREHHELKLVGNENYRADLWLSDRDTLLRHLDHLLEKLDKGSVAA